MKNILNSKKIINNLPTKLSWSLLWSLLFVSLIFLLVFILPNSNEFLNNYRQFVIKANGWPADQSIQNTVLIQSLVILVIIRIVQVIMEMTALFLILWAIFRAFKTSLNFWKLINIYLYAKLASTLVMTPYFLFVAFNRNYSNGLIEQTFNYLLKQDPNLAPSISGNYYLIILGIISAIVFFYLFIGGLVIYLKSIKKNQSLN